MLVADYLILDGLTEELFSEDFLVDYFNFKDWFVVECG